MNYVRILTINDKMVSIVSDSWILERNTPGRAILAVKSRDVLEGIVTFDLGLDGVAVRWFTGYIESCSRIDDNQVRLVVRELGAVLAARWPLSLRNVTARDVLKQLAYQTGLAFSLEDADWNKQSIPHFINIGSGLEALNQLGVHLEINDYCQQCQADGSIYIGSAAGMVVSQKIIELPASLFTETSASGATCALLPELRLGQRLRIGDGAIVRINSISVTDEKMRINWE
jgi:hypothetical protein